MPLHVSSTCAHHQVKIALHSLWYHNTCRCYDTRGCVMQFRPPDDKHMCSKHVEAWNKLMVKQKFCATSWLITEINILRCTVSKTSKKKKNTGDMFAAECPFRPLLSLSSSSSSTSCPHYYSEAPSFNVPQFKILTLLTFVFSDFCVKYPSLKIFVSSTVKSTAQISIQTLNGVVTVSNWEK